MKCLIKLALFYYINILDVEHTVELEDSGEFNGAKWSCALCGAEPDKEWLLLADVWTPGGAGMLAPNSRPSFQPLLLPPNLPLCFQFNSITSTQRNFLQFALQFRDEFYLTCLASHNVLVIVASLCVSPGNELLVPGEGGGAL